MSSYNTQAHELGEDEISRGEQGRTVPILDGGGNDFYEMHFKFNGGLLFATPLAQDYIRQAIGYALKASLRGEEILPGSFMFFLTTDGDTIVSLWYDSTKSRRDDLGDGIHELSEIADEIMRNGSPIRKTNRQGPGTMGTRLVDPLHEPLDWTPLLVGIALGHSSLFENVVVPGGSKVFFGSPADSPHSYFKQVTISKVLTMLQEIEAIAGTTVMLECCAYAIGNLPDEGLIDVHSYLIEVKNTRGIE